MRLEHNRQSAIAASDPKRYAHKFRAYQKDVFKPRLKQVLAERNRLIDKVRWANYTTKQWKQVSKLSLEEQQTIHESLFGNKEAEKGKPTIATSPILDELKTINLKDLPVRLGLDPYEDFYNNYTEVDPNSHITIAEGTPNKISFAGLARNEDAYVYKDKGAGHFSGDFEHLVQVYIDIGIVGGANWHTSDGLANTVDDWKGIADADGDELSVQEMASTGNFSQYLHELDGGAAYGDSKTGLSLDTSYYLIFERDEAVGTYGTIYCYIYSDASRETLVDTLSVALHTSKKDFRYIYGLQTYNSGQVGTISGYTQNLDLQEEEGTPKLSDVTWPLGWTPGKELQADITSEHNHPLGWTPGKQLDAALTSQKNYPLAWTPDKELDAALSSAKDYSLVWSPDKALDAALSSQHNYPPGWFSDSSVAVGGTVPKLSEVTWPLGWASSSSKGIIVWKGLTDTLFAAQQKPARLPYVEAKLYDYEQGIKRLYYTRLYQGTEPDNHHGIAFDGQGSMHRIRAAASNTLYRQKITSPGPSSDYTEWTQIATDCDGPCTIAASGAKVYIFYRTTSNVLWKYYSHDYGQSWDDAQLVSYAGVLSLAACWWGTGDVVVCFALKANQLNGITLDSSDQTTTPHTWSDGNHPLLATYGIGATYNASLDQCEVVFAGKESDSPYNHHDLFRTKFSNTYNFLALESFLMAADGEDLTYEYPDCHLPSSPQGYESTRVLAVEKFVGTTAYTRPLACHMVKGTYWSDTTFTEPKPFLDISSNYGLRLQSTADYLWMERPDGVWQAPRPATTPLDLTGTIVSLSLQRPGTLLLELNNSKGRYASPGEGELASLRFRSEIVLKLGYKTTAGDEAVDAGTYWIDSWEHSSAPNQSLFTIHCLDGWGLMDRWSARYQMRWNKDEVSPRSVWQILYQLLARVGIRLTNTPPKPQSSAINNFYPDFAVSPGTQGDAAITRLLSFVPDKLVFRGQEAFTKNPIADEESCYSYGTDHVIKTARYTDAVTPSRSRALGQAGDDSRIVQDAFDWPLLQLAIDILDQDYDPNLATTTRAQERADAILRQTSLRAKLGNLVIPTNVGQELLDVFDVTDARCGIDQENYRAQSIQTDYDRRKAIYDQRITIGAP